MAEGEDQAPGLSDQQYLSQINERAAEVKKLLLANDKGNCTSCRDNNKYLNNR